MSASDKNSVVPQNENEGAAKRSLAVLTELYRRHVWRDARTVNVIGEHVDCAGQSRVKVHLWHALQTGNDSLILPGAWHSAAV